MKKLLLLATVLFSGLLTLPSQADTLHHRGGYEVYISSYLSCGTPIYAKRPIRKFNNYHRSYKPYRSYHRSHYSHQNYRPYRAHGRNFRQTRGSGRRIYDYNRSRIRGASHYRRH